MDILDVDASWWQWVGGALVAEYLCLTLLFQMSVDRVSKFTILLTFVVQQCMLIFCLHFDYGSPGIALFIYLCVKIYENVGQQTFEIKKEFTLTSEFLRTDGRTAEEGVVNTGLRCASYVDKKIQFSNILQLQDVTGFKDFISEDLTKPLKKSNVQTENCFLLQTSTVDDTKEHPLIIICNTPAEKNQWIQKLKHMLGLLDEDARLLWLKNLLRKINGNTEVEDFQADQVYNFEVVKEILKLAQRQFSANYLLAEFECHKKASIRHSLGQIQAYGISKFSKAKAPAEATVESKEKITWAELVEIFKRISVPPSVESIFNRILGKRQSINSLPPEKFRDFLKSAQMESLENDELRKKICKYEPIVGGCNLSIVGIANYLLSEERSIVLDVEDSMDHPLTHYFIASSHNTYLTKDQIKSKSSVDMYIQALQKGCRCLELDCWDGPDNKPIIYHGHTLTSKILFKDVIIAIKENAFCKSPYPVILSFENHCSLEQQKVMAQILRTTLGDMLYTKPIDENENIMQSPNELKGFIIIKAKKAKESLDVESEEDEDEDEDEDDLFELGNLDESEILKRLEEGKEFDNADNLSLGSYNELTNDGMNENLDIAEEQLPDVPNASGAGKASESKDDTEVKKQPKDAKMNVLSLLRSVKPNINVNIEMKSGAKKQVRKIAKELSDLVAYCQPVGFKDFTHSKEKCKHYEMSSFGEKKALRLSKEEATLFVEYNRRQLSRIYPSGLRVDSSNFDPVQFWNVGCQLVALNYQTACTQMHLNDALFSSNKGCGYVLKPEFLRTNSQTFDPFQKFNQSQTVTIQIISAHYLPIKGQQAVSRASKQFQVQIRVRGVPDDDKVQTTAIAKNNGLDPAWDEKFVFKIHAPELAFVSFVVTSSKLFVAQYTIPYKNMAKGYRKIPLLTKYSKPTDNAFLLIYIASM